MTRRERVFSKYGGKCAYSGTPLEPDWQIDHVVPIRRNWDGTCMFPNNNKEDNMVPVQKTINHYKHSLGLELFRTWLLGGLHERLKKLPKTTRVMATQRRKEYLLKVAGYFGITETTPFSGTFYFETLKKEQDENNQLECRP